MGLVIGNMSSHIGIYLLHFFIVLHFELIKYIKIFYFSSYLFYVLKKSFLDREAYNILFFKNFGMVFWMIFF